jgi:hypothetical protein
LHHFVARSVACVLHINTNLELTIRTDAHVTELQVCDLELRVAKTKAEWKLRSRR